MSIKPIYANRHLYLDKMMDFVDGAMSGIDFSSWFLRQRSQDIDEGRAMRSEEDRATIATARDQNISGTISDEEFVRRMEAISWPYSNLFLDLFDELQAVDIEDFKEYFYGLKYDCIDDIPEDRRVTEDELRRRVKAKLDLLKANKGKW